MDVFPEGGLLKGSSGKAQSVVEFALVLPVLLLLMVMLIDLGFLFYAQVVVTNAAWEGARTGATIVDPPRGDQEITSAVLASAYGLDQTKIQIQIQPAQDEAPRNLPHPAPRGENLCVIVRYDAVINLGGVHVPLTGKAVTQMEYQNP